MLPNKLKNEYIVTDEINDTQTKRREILDNIYAPSKNKNPQNYQLINTKLIISFRK